MAHCVRSLIRYVFLLRGGGENVEFEVSYSRYNQNNCISSSTQTIQQRLRVSCDKLIRVMIVPSTTYIRYIFFILYKSIEWLCSYHM